MKTGPKEALRNTALHARRVVRLLRQPTLGLPKTEVLTAHAKLDALAAKAAVDGKPVASPLDLLGYAFHFANFELFRFLFEEIFLREDYFFEAETRAPFILDGGSNIGASILYFKRLYPEARIVGFEPMAPTFDVLRRNVEANGLADVTVHNRALAAAPGTSTLHFDPDEAGSLLTSVAPERSTGGVCEVENAVLSDFIDGPVDLLKLDIEGAEWPVLQELAASGKLGLIRRIFLEYHHHLEADHDAFARVLALFEEAGFGYLISSSFKSPPREGVFQDIILYCYRKEEHEVIAPDTASSPH